MARTHGFSGFIPTVDPDFDTEGDFDDIPTKPYTQLDHANKLWGPCEDDHETTAPYVGIMPEESRAIWGRPSPVKLK